MKRKLYITLLGLLSTIMTAAVPYCDVRKFSITDGLAANTIGFNRISHGNYVLKVRATNSHGVWSKCALPSWKASGASF